MPAAKIARVLSLDGCAVDPLLVGVDREFLESFPKELLRDTGSLPLRRYRGVSLVVPPAGPRSDRALRKLQRASDTRIVSVPAIHRYGIDLLLRYWEGGDGRHVPPIWVPAERRPFLHRFGDALTTTGRVQPAAVLVSLLLTSPLTSLSPVLVAGVGREAHALFLHGPAGLKLGARFPVKLLPAVLNRLRAEFELEEIADRVTEGQGRSERGFDDLTGLLLPPLRAHSFILEPRTRR